MLYAIDRAFQIAVADNDIKAIIVAADGPHFSSGHELNDLEDLNDYDTVTLWGGFDEEGQTGMINGEEEIYLGFC